MEGRDNCGKKYFAASKPEVLGVHFEETFSKRVCSLSLF